MEQDYYIPTAEDFRVGFEFQFKHKTGKWKNYRFFEKYSYDSWKEVEVRVPYLTKEAIESEGWEYSFKNDPDLIHFKRINSPHTLIWSSKDKRISISIPSDFFRDYIILYDGTCRCINDFRLIIKLLNI